MKSITPLELYELVRQGHAIDLIDVRTPAEFQEVHAEGAVSAPLGELDPPAVLRARKAACTRSNFSWLMIAGTACSTHCEGGRFCFARLSVWLK